MPGILKHSLTCRTAQYISAANVNPSGSQVSAPTRVHINAAGCCQTTARFEAYSVAGSQSFRSYSLPKIICPLPIKSYFFLMFIWSCVVSTFAHDFFFLAFNPRTSVFFQSHSSSWTTAKDCIHGSSPSVFQRTIYLLY